MNQSIPAEQLAHLQKEFRLLGEETDKSILELRVEVDRLKLEIAALKTILGSIFPTFAEQFPQVLARTIQEVDPEAD